jgi:phosphoribosylformylglycinamidine cyclo-ligase
MSGTIVGVVDKDRIIDGKTIEKGDVLIGFESNGLHTNGYSLARNILLDKFSVNDKIEGLENSLGDELLKVHKSYLKLITELANNIKIKGFSHITGGGIIGNTKRIIPEGLKLKVDWNSWEMPAIFKLIQKTGNVSDEEMREVFNIGIGLIAVVNSNDVEKVLGIANSMKENARVIGKVE